MGTDGVRAWEMLRQTETQMATLISIIEQPTNYASDPPQPRSTA